MAKITGAKEHVARLRRLGGSGPGGGDLVKDVDQALYVGGRLLQVEAQLSISNGSVSGKAHKPSSPGQPPNNDTGVLANNIEAVKVGPLHVQVSSNAPYAAALEFGTSKMAERPYMRPAAAKTRADVANLVRDAVNRAIRRR